MSRCQLYFDREGDLVVRSSRIMNGHRRRPSRSVDQSTDGTRRASERASPGGGSSGEPPAPSGAGGGAATPDESSGRRPRTVARLVGRLSNSINCVPEET